MEAYMTKAKEYDKYMKEQFAEFERGKEFLASMMGKKCMTQKEIDEAINYLLPSSLFVPKSRPMMKPPDQIIGKKESVSFDSTGRPHHFLFYTTKPKFSQLLHDAAAEIEKLNNIQQESLQKGMVPPKPITLPGCEWLSHEQLEKKLNEKLYSVDHAKYIEAFDVILNHPFNQQSENFLRSYCCVKSESLTQKLPTPIIEEDGSIRVIVERSKRDTSVAQVEVKFPGTGSISINGQGIDFFETISCREQVSYKILY
ncbi:hypothetical protein RUM43_011143 [Polyplax serrata]|uniref:28S ribosomal protein S9, mitochondrial n=1 Tax=Polyplax serrata TaxID=468196 RepID=A0AAN8P8R2_POLSC